jgi:hypothetical protein
VSPRPAPARRVLPTSPFAVREAGPTASQRLAADDRVTHDRLGLGRVVRIVDDYEVIVEFSAGEGATMAVPHGKLTKL